MEKSILFCSLACLLIFGLPFLIASIAVSVSDSDNSCQTTDSIGLELHEWLLGAGISGLIITIIMITVIGGLFLSISRDSYVGAISSTLVIFLLSLGSSIFSFVYSIIGAVILYRSNIDCLTDATPLGVMTQIVLCLYWLGILYTCFSRRKSNDD